MPLNINCNNLGISVTFPVSIWPNCHSPPKTPLVIMEYLLQSQGRPMSFRCAWLLTANDSDSDQWSWYLCQCQCHHCEHSGTLRRVFSPCTPVHPLRPGCDCRHLVLFQPSEQTSLIFLPSPFVSFRWVVLCAIRPRLHSGCALLAADLHAGLLIFHHPRWWKMTLSDVNEWGVITSQIKPCQALSSAPNQETEETQIRRG